MARDRRTELGRLGNPIWEPPWSLGVPSTIDFDSIQEIAPGFNAMEELLVSARAVAGYDGHAAARDFEDYCDRLNTDPYLECVPDYDVQRAFRRDSEYRAAIEDALDMAHGTEGYFTVSDLARESGGGKYYKQSARDAVRHLVDVGKLARSGTGSATRYRDASKEPDRSPFDDASAAISACAEIAARRRPMEARLPKDAALAANEPSMTRTTDRFGG